MRASAAALACLLASFFTPQIRAGGAAAPADWRPLFDGKTLNGWEHVGPGEFVIEDGVLRTKGGMGLLWYSREKLGDCMIRVVYKTGTQRSNSGVYIRIADKPKEPWFAVHHGFEIQIMDTAREGHGPGRSTRSRRPRRSPQAGRVEHAGDHSQGEPHPDRRSTASRLPNSIPAASNRRRTDKTGEGDPARGPRPPSGYIGLQNHDRNSVVYFKEVSVRPLATENR